MHFMIVSAIGGVIRSKITSGKAYQATLLQFLRIHKKLRVTPAMEAGIADHVWSIAKLLA